MASVYEPQNLKEEAAKNMMIVETAVNLEAIIQLLVAKGIIANVEINHVKEQIKNTPKYKAAYEMYKGMMDAAELYDKNPQKYLQELFRAKMNGTIR